MQPASHEDSEPSEAPHVSSSTATTIPQPNSDARTTSSGPSILETPLAAMTTPPAFVDHFRDSYRISPQTAALFEAHSRRMEEEQVGGETERSPIATRRLSQRKSSTDLRRQNALR
jgi:hypothetical protein